MSRKEEKKEFEKNLLWRFQGATVTSEGRIVIDKGKVLDEDWWKRKVEKAWKERNNYPGRLR